MRGLKLYNSPTHGIVPCRTPPGVRGLKLTLMNVAGKNYRSHPARGAWIETWFCDVEPDDLSESHPARGAWIETMLTPAFKHVFKSHPARGAWIETGNNMVSASVLLSHPARGAWIETRILPK